MHTEPRAARIFLLASRSPRPGDRCRYPAQPINKNPSNLNYMSPASKIGHIRGGVAIASFFFPFLAVVLHGWACKQWPQGQNIFFWIFAITVVGAMALFFTAMFRWKVRCPNCGKYPAKFVYPENDREFLHCENCNYKEETGWTLDSG